MAVMIALLLLLAERLLLLLLLLLLCLLMADVRVDVGLEMLLLVVKVV